MLTEMVPWAILGLNVPMLCFSCNKLHLVEHLGHVCHSALLLLKLETFSTTSRPRSPAVGC